MKKFIKTAWKVSTYNWRSLLLFEISYRIAATLLVVLYGRMALGFSLRQQGISYLTAENFGKVMANPWTVAVTIAAIVFLLFLLNIEITGLFSCFEHSGHQEKISMLHLWKDGITGNRSRVRRHPFRRLWYVLLAAPFLCVHLLAREFSSVVFLQFAVKHLAKVFHGEIVLGITAGVVLILSAVAACSLPVRFFELGKEWEIAKKTAGMLRQNWKTAVLGMGLTQLLILVLSVGIYFLGAAGVVLYAMATKQPSHMVSAVLVYGKWLQSGLGIFIGSIALVLMLLFLYLLYDKAYPRDGKKRRELPVRGGKFRQLLHTRYMVWSLSALLLLTESACLVYAAGNYAGDMAGMNPGMQITAHRGGARMAPENTMSALSYAVESLSDYAEIDVQETKDGEIVLLHDTSLKRTTGLKANIWKLTLAEVKQLDAGVKFNKKFRGEQIPTLEEVLNFAKGRIRLNIEVKYNGHNKNIVKKVVKIIQECDFTEECVITSMNYSFLKKVKALEPQIRTGYITQMAYGDVTAMEAADFFSIKHTAVNEAFVRRAHAAGKQVHTWTVNRRGDMKRMIDCGADNIITDDPELVRKVLTGKVDRKPDFGILMRYALDTVG